MTTYIGQRRRFSADFESDGTDTDPTTVAYTVMDPDGEVVDSGTPTNDTGAGQFHVDVDLDKAGPWVVRFVGTGTVPAAVEITETVERSPFVA